MVGWDDLSGVEQDIAREYVEGLKLMAADATQEHTDHLLKHHKDEIAKRVRSFTVKLCTHRLAETEIPAVGSQTVEEFWSGAPMHVRAALAHGTLNEAADHKYTDLPDWMRDNVKNQVETLRAEERSSQTKAERIVEGSETKNPVREELRGVTKAIGQMVKTLNHTLTNYEGVLKRIESEEYKKPAYDILEGVGIDLQEVDHVLVHTLELGAIPIRVGDRIVTTKDIQWSDFENEDHVIHEGTRGTVLKLGPIQVQGKMDYEVKLDRPVKGTEIIFVEPGEFKLLEVKLR